MKLILFSIIVLLPLTAVCQGRSTSKPVNQSDRAYRYEQVIVNYACRESRKLVSNEWKYTKGLKFAEDYQYGDEYPVDDKRYDSTYCISGFFTYKGDFNETFREYYYCWLKLKSIKPEHWEQMVMKFSPFPFTE